MLEERLHRMVQVPSPEVEEGIHASCSGSSASQRAECKGAGVTWTVFDCFKTPRLQEFKTNLDLSTQTMFPVVGGSDT